MLSRITGILESLDGASALIAVPDTGLAYEALLPRALATELADRVGRPITLHTLQYFESQNQGASFIPRLIGFASPDDRRFFHLLTSVKGLGNRKALRAMAAPAANIARAIIDRDTRALQELPEIGKRLAETIIAELHEKVADFALASSSAAAPRAALAELKPAQRAPAEQAAAALVRLGETPADADRMVRAALHNDPTLATADAILAATFGMRPA